MQGYSIGLPSTGLWYWVTKHRVTVLGYQVQGKRYWVLGHNNMKGIEEKHSHKEIRGEDTGAQISLVRS